MFNDHYDIFNYNNLILKENETHNNYVASFYKAILYILIFQNGSYFKMLFLFI